jgi:hypothetical protein
MKAFRCTLVSSRLIAGLDDFIIAAGSAGRRAAGRICLIGILSWTATSFGAPYTITLPPGSSLIANHLDNGGNSLNTVLSGVPDGTQLQKWNCSSFVTYTYDEGLGTWSPPGGTLRPGEGAVLINASGSSFLHTFNGTAHVPSCPLPSACACGREFLASRQTAAIGSYETITGFNPMDGAVLKRLAGGSLVTYSFSDGAWFPSVPSVNIGEAVWVTIPCSSSSFTVSGLTNRTVECGSTWNFGTPAVTSLCCTSATVTVSSTVTNGSCPWTATRTWQALDCATNTFTFSETITITDSTPPALTCPTNKIVQCGMPWSFDAPNVFDACCASPTLFVLHTATNGSCPRVAIRTWAAVDCCGLTNTCSQTVTIIDADPPSLSCPPPVTVSCAAQIPPPNPNSVVASDGCGGPVSVTFVGDSISASSCPNRFTVTRTYRGTDGCGNTTTCHQIITVNDVTPPTISCPGNVTVSCASQIPAPNIGLVTASDACGGTPTVTHVGDVMTASNCFNRVTVTRTYRASDSCGNTATCTQTITVNDTTPPTLTCPPALTVNCASLVPAPSPGSILAADNCSGSVAVTHVGDVITPGACPNRYTIARTYQARDLCGNAATCTQTITVNDTTPPTLT